MSFEYKPKKPVRSVSRRACLSCREKKIKCDGVHKCRNCEQMNINCVFVKSQRGGRRTASKNSATGGSTSAVAAAAASAVTMVPSSSANTPLDVSQVMAAANHPHPPPAPSSTQYHQQPHPPPPRPPPPSGGVPHDHPPHPPPPPPPPPPPHHRHSPHPLGPARPPPPPQLMSMYPTSSPSMHPQHSHNPPPHAHHHHQPPHHGPPPPPPPHIAHQAHQSSPQPHQQPQPQPQPQQQFPNISSENVTLAQPNFNNNNNNNNNNNSMTTQALYDKISSLENELSLIKARIPSSGPVINVGLPNWQISAQDMAVLDLPPVAIADHLIDLFYQYFHTNHPFLYPKTAFFRYIKVSTTVSLVHAMFAISCRFLDPPPESSSSSSSASLSPNTSRQTPTSSSSPAAAAAAGISPYMRDPRYWINNANKYMDSLSSIDQVKTLLLIGIALQADGELTEGDYYINKAAELCHYHKLERRYSTNLDRDADSHALAIANLAQLWECESLVRTLWEMWRCRVQLAIWRGDASMLPPFNSNLCLPVPNSLYNEQLVNWNRKRLTWSDFETELLASTNHEEKRGEYLTFYDTTFVVAALQAASTALRHRKKSETMNSLDTRVRSIDQFLPKEPSTLTVSAHMLLYGTTVSTHYDTALLAFPLRPTNVDAPIYPGKCAVHPLDKVHAELEASDTLRHSYLLSTWASDGVRRLIVPEKNDNYLQHWLGLHESFGNLVEFSSVVLANEIWYARHSKPTPSRDGMHVKSLPELIQGLELCMSFLTQMGKVWKMNDKSLQRVKEYYDKVMSGM